MENLLNTKPSGNKMKICVYCNKKYHKPLQFKFDTNERWIIFRERSLCNSEQTCIIYRQKHPTSICDYNKGLLLNTSQIKGPVTYPVVLIKVDGITCRAVLDTGSGSSYNSASLLNKPRKESMRRDSKKIEMMLYTANSKVDNYNVKNENLQRNFNCNTEINVVDKDALLTIPNPNYESMMSDYPHRRGVKMDEFQTKPVFPIHVILRIRNFTKIKTKEMPRGEKVGDS